MNRYCVLCVRTYKDICVYFLVSFWKSALGVIGRILNHRLEASCNLVLYLLSAVLFVVMVLLSLCVRDFQDHNLSYIFEGFLSVLNAVIWILFRSAHLYILNYSLNLNNGTFTFTINCMPFR